MSPRRGPATVPLTFCIPLPQRDALDRMQQQTGRTSRRPFLQDRLASPWYRYPRRWRIHHLAARRRPADMA
jgi:hypothetical protein